MHLLFVKRGNQRVGIDILPLIHCPLMRCRILRTVTVASLVVSYVIHGYEYRDIFIVAA